MTAGARVRGPWRLCGWCAFAIAVEVGLYASYRGHDARFHWFTHAFVGSAAALTVMTVVTLVRRRPVPRPLLWPMVTHVFAMIPDLVFSGGYAHRRWMDVFLGHIRIAARARMPLSERTGGRQPRRPPRPSS